MSSLESRYRPFQVLPIARLAEETGAKEPFSLFWCPFLVRVERFLMMKKIILYAKTDWQGEMDKNLKQSRGGFVLFCFVLFCFVLFCFVLFCFVLFCFVLFCFVRTVIERGAEEAQKALLKMASSKGALLACSLACVRALQLYLALIECFPYACPEPVLAEWREV
jgi:hypothetical protein